MRAAGCADDRSTVAALAQMEGGWSRHSYRAEVVHGDGERRTYVVRVRPRGAQLDTDLGQEFRTLELMMREPLPSPPVRGYEPGEDSAFDGPFFVMDHLEGSAPNVWRPADRAELERDWNGPRGIASDFADHLVAIHAVDAAAAAAVVPVRDFGQVVDHWQSTFERERLVADPVIDEAFAWVREHAPDPVEPCLVHGDYRIGNCLVGGGRITGILDWELSHVGDPRFDLGYIALAYMRGKFVAPGSEMIGAVADPGWFYECWSAGTGRPVDQEVVRTFAAVGALMLFTIMSTGVRVCAEGRSDDVRLAWGRFTLPNLRQDLVHLMGW
jgi:aminoglycoside phosphotransferase (APT) family kinase protein